MALEVFEGLKRDGSPTGQSTESSSTSESIDAQIRKAQMDAKLKRKEYFPVPSATVHPVKPEDLCGIWKDTYGNTVTVYSTDAFETRLVASLSKPPRRDIVLPLQAVDRGRGWHCGGATLTRRSGHMLWWQFVDGTTSVWSRKNPKSTLQEPDASASWCYFDQPVSHMGQMWVPMLIPIPV
mmetsp:Transcript_22073/g.48776  ORF Transcript_22073/g.48776 Transcript_22073/m.48776 type:complete len:181 (-) Transcript_22073:124-666(-)|eukprot:CAMPEP_0170615214 /NCGR_PEP_ID=MMETSP0224-20130122/25218_1 /TAXON_ID=285029 /ORGANISM="Togula jolla, Strain CCCM 725" /LENGTH=180 /DNA_ID=CAMNT_0010940931 /DNA_START=79 /DNA_END=621 /DNA_ORIENTATION=+